MAGSLGDAGLRAVREGAAFHMRTPLRPPGSQGKTVYPGRAGFRPQGAGVWPEQELLCSLWGEAGVLRNGTGPP